MLRKPTDWVMSVGFSLDGLLVAAGDRFGGLFVWGRAASRMYRGRTAADTMRLGVELCTVYWHYLLLVWFVLFGLLLIT